MSLLANKNIGLIVISALLIFSCKEKENVGLELEGSDNKVGTYFTDTLSISTAVSLENDSIPTHNLSNFLVGAVKDPVFGDVSAETYIQLLLAYENKNSAYSSIDSVKLILRYDYHYGDTTQSQTINVKELSSTADLQTSTTYFSTKAALPTETDLLDSNLSFQARPYKSAGTQEILLKKSFGKQLLDIIGTGKTATQFLSAFKGLALLPKSSEFGVILTPYINTNATRLVVYYKASPSNTLDSMKFYLNTTSARFSRIIRNPATSSDLSSLTISGQELNSGGTVYVQAGSGIRTKLKFNSLMNLKNNLGNVAINKAELVLDLSGNDELFKPVLLLYKLNSNGSIKKYWDGSSIQDDIVQGDLYDVKGHSNPQTASFNKTTESYTFNISSYINAILQGQEENNGLIIAPTPGWNNSSVNRIKVDPANVKLKVYYTKIN